MTVATPTVLVVDDHPDDERVKFQSSEVRYAVVHPQDVEADLLNRADLVLVDYVIDDWTARTNATEIGLRPENGVALAAVLREQADPNRATGFAIHTGQAEKLWMAPAEPRRHLIARAYNLEWVFLKSEASSVVPQTASLAKAIRALPPEWPGEDHASALRTVEWLLALGSGPDDIPVWATAALREVEACRPPLTELSVGSHGLIFLRWLLHRILPYPCFLHDTHRLAARLRIKHSALVALLSQGLAEILKPYTYRGVLSGFLGPRWWRAGVERFLWELGDGATLPADEQRRRLGRRLGTDLTGAASDHSVVCIDENYNTLPETYPPNDVVRVQPDDWPVFAQQAWAPITRVRECRKLATVVVAEDQEKIVAGGGRT
jgi:hypothetical protein